MKRKPQESFELYKKRRARHNRAMKLRLRNGVGIFWKSHENGTYNADMRTKKAERANLKEERKVQLIKQKLDGVPRHVGLIEA